MGGPVLRAGRTPASPAVPVTPSGSPAASPVVQKVLGGSQAASPAVPGGRTTVSPAVQETQGGRTQVPAGKAPVPVGKAEVLGGTMVPPTTFTTMEYPTITSAGKYSISCLALNSFCYSCFYTICFKVLSILKG